MQARRVVLAFSGGLDAVAALPRLAARLEAEVVTVTLDLGQGRELEHVRAQALEAGAVRAHVIDAREAFAHDILLPALAAGIIEADGHARALELTRPMIARRLVDVARMEQATAVAHGARGADARRLDRLLADLAPDLPRLALSATSQAESRLRDLHVDENLWGRTLAYPTASEALDPPPDALFTLTTPPAGGVSEPAVVDLAFAGGAPVAVNAVPMSLVELIDVVGTIAGDHGVGRTDALRPASPHSERLIQDLHARRADPRVQGFVDPQGGARHDPQAGGPAFRLRPASADAPAPSAEGVRSASRIREIGEAPAAVVLAFARRELEQAALDSQLRGLKAQLLPAYAALVDEGAWFAPARTALDAFINAASAGVSGVVRLQLFRGACRLLGRRLDPQPSPAAASAA